LTTPFAGLLGTLSDHIASWDQVRGFYGFEILLLALMIFPAARSFLRNLASRRFAIAWIAALMLLVSLDALVWIEDWAFLRAAAEYWSVGAVIAMGTRGLPQRAAVALASVGWLAVALHVLQFR
jgi:hypothetical protein